MGKKSVKRRSFEIRSKRKRKRKVRELKEKYLKAKNHKDKDEIIEKIQKIAPFYPIKNILKEDKKK